MSKIAKALALSIAMALPSGTAAAQPAPSPSAEQRAAQSVEKSTPKPSASTAAARISNFFVITCFTCGNNYPFLIRRVNLNGSNNRVLEYGPRCTLPLVFRRDNIPYLCGTP
jgi:hypothetical protein